MSITIDWEKDDGAKIFENWSLAVGPRLLILRLLVLRWNWISFISFSLQTIRNLTLVDLQLDAQNSYLFMYNIFIKILYMFRALPCSSSGGQRRNCIYAASGIVTLCRSCAPVKKEISFLAGAQDSHLQRVTIPEAVYVQLRLRPPEDEQGNARNM